MRTWLVAALIIGLAGCMSVQEIRTDGPIETFSTDKGELEVSQCVLFAWQDDAFAGSQVFLQAGRNGGSTVFTQAFREFADIYRQQEQTVVAIYNASRSTSLIINRRIAGIKTCL